MLEAVTESCEDLVTQAQPYTRVRTGAERAGIHVESVTGGGFTVTGTVSTGGESSAYDIYQHEGTRYIEGTHFLERALLENSATYAEAMARAARGQF